MTAIGGTRRLSRAEMVRQRRIKEAEIQQEQVRLQNYRVLRPKTVITRNYSQSQPLYQSGRNRVRKAYYYKAKETGSEIRFRSMPTVRLGWRVLSGALSAVMFILIMYMAISPMFKVNQLKINGLQRLSSLEVESSLQIGNTAIFALNPKKVVDTLTNAFPELTNIRVTISLPATVSISVTERVPVVSWVTPDRTYWIDLEGTVFPARGEANPPLTILSNDNPPAPPDQIGSNETILSLSLPTRTIDPAVLNAIRELSSRMPQETTFLYSEQDGLGWNDTRGWQVYIGMDLSNLPVKITEYEAIINQLDQKGIHPMLVSVEHIDAPFFRTE